MGVKIMSENVVHITVGVLFDLYVKDLIKKETYDDCIRAYKEYQQAKQGIVHNEPELTPALYHSGTGVKLSEPIEFVHAPVDGKWRTSEVPSSESHVDAIDYEDLLTVVHYEHTEGTMCKSAYEQLSKIINEHKQHQKDTQRMIRRAEPFKL